MKTPRAAEKLQEAQFFLRYLQQESRKTVRNWPGAFRYYLSAFLNAEYSVTKVHEMETKNELKKKGLKRTYDRCTARWRKNLLPQDKTLWDEMGKQRGKEVHAQGADVVTKEKAVPVHFLSGVEITGSPVTLVGVTETEMKAIKKEGLPPGTSAWGYLPEFYFNGDPPAQIVQTCSRYLVLLERFIQEFNDANF